MINDEPQFDDMKEFAAEINAVKTLHEIKPSEALQTRILASLETEPLSPAITPADADRFIIKGRPFAAFWMVRVLVPIGAVAALMILVLAKNYTSPLTPESPEADSFSTAMAPAPSESGDAAGARSATGESAAPSPMGLTKQESADQAAIDAAVDEILDESSEDASTTADEDANTQSELSNDQSFKDFDQVYSPSDF